MRWVIRVAAVLASLAQGLSPSPLAHATGLLHRSLLTADRGLTIEAIAEPRMTDLNAPANLQGAPVALTLLFRRHKIDKL
jgi:hypothetical protein